MFSRRLTTIDQFHFSELLLLCKALSNAAAPVSTEESETFDLRAVQICPIGNAEGWINHWMNNEAARQRKTLSASHLSKACLPLGIKAQTWTPEHLRKIYRILFLYADVAWCLDKERKRGKQMSDTLGARRAIDAIPFLMRTASLWQYVL